MVGTVAFWELHDAKVITYHTKFLALPIDFITFCLFIISTNNKTLSHCYCKDKR